MSEVALADVCSRVDYGLTAAATASDTGVRFLRITDIDGDVIDWAHVPFVEVDDRSLASNQLGAGDVVVARTGASVGRSAWVRPPVPAVFASYLVRFVADPNKLDSRFLGLVLKGDAWRSYVSSIAHGKSAQPNMSASAMAAFRFRLPRLSTQRAIADVLGALDDKIAANSRLTSEATELADAIFEAAKRAAALESRDFDAVATVAGGATPSTKVPEYWDGGIPWATPTDVTGLSAPFLDTTARTITSEGLDRCSTSLYPVDSILMTSRATIGAFALAKVPVAVNQGFIVAHARDPRAQLWLYHEMRSRVADFLLHANGATFLELSKSKFRAIGVSWPEDPEAFEAFESRVRPVHERAYAAFVESRDLAELRDTLLPHLMSGRLSVREAEARVEEVL